MNPNRRMGGWSDLRIASPYPGSVAVTAPFYTEGDAGRIEWNDFQDNMDYNVGFAIRDPTDADYADCLIAAKAGTLPEADVAERTPSTATRTIRPSHGAMGLVPCRSETWRRRYLPGTATLLPPNYCDADIMEQY